MAHKNVGFYNIENFYVIIDDQHQAHWSQKGSVLIDTHLQYKFIWKVILR